MTVEFARLWAFALLPLPVVAWLVLPRLPVRGALQVPTSILEALRHVSGESRGRRQALPEGLAPRAIGWLALVVALAGPYVRQQALLEPTGRDVMIAVDLSASMASRLAGGGKDGPRRIDLVYDALRHFIARRRGDRIGFIAFAREAYLIAPLTFDTAAVSEMLEEATIGLPGRRTDIGQAIGLTVKLLRAERSGERILVLVTDGETNAGELAALDAAKLAVEDKVTIHTVGFTDKISAQNREHLHAVSTLTGGRAFVTTNSAELGDVLSQIDEVAPTAIDADRKFLRDDWTWLAILAALMAAAWIGWREARSA